MRTHVQGHARSMTSVISSMLGGTIPPTRCKLSIGMPKKPATTSGPFTSRRRSTTTCCSTTIVRGFGSRRFVTQAFIGLNLDNRALSGVLIGVVMGRHAGFLTASSSLARKYFDEGPHFIYLPSGPFRRTNSWQRSIASTRNMGSARSPSPRVFRMSTELRSRRHLSLSGRTRRARKYSALRDRDSRRFAGRSGKNKIEN